MFYIRACSPIHGISMSLPRVYNRRSLRTVVVAAEAADKVCSLDKNKFMRGSEGLLLLLLLLLPCGAVLSNAV